MNCQEARQHWMLYLDSEGDPQMHLGVSDHLGECPACAEWFARQQRFEQALTECLAEGEATPQLWGRVLSRAGIKPRTGARWSWPLLAASLAAALMVLAGVWLLRTQRQPPAAELTRLTVDCHERHLQGLSQVEFRSQDGESVARYLGQQVSFPVNRPPGKSVDFAVEGCGVCRWAPRPMAYIAGRAQQTSVSIFVLARDSLDAFPHTRDCLIEEGGRYRCREGGYQTVSAVTPDNVVVVVGTAPQQALDHVLNAYLGDREE